MMEECSSRVSFFSCMMGSTHTTVWCKETLSRKTRHEKIAPHAIEMALTGQKKENLTFLHEDALPPLPLPPLDQTCEKLVKSVEPFCRTETEYSIIAYCAGA